MGFNDGLTWNQSSIVPNLAGASTILSVIERVVYDEDEYKSSR